MLQRIQSIYLLLAALVIFSLFLFPLVHNVYLDGRPVSIMVTGVYQDLNGRQSHTESFTALTIGTAIIGLVPLAIIFLYKNRKQQIQLCLLGILLSVLIVVMYVSQMNKLVKPTLALSCVFPVMIVIGYFMAFRNIRKDEKLIKTLDKLR